jgi:hypothetical protein
MRKIVNSTYISLDGVIEAPHTWPPTGPDDEAAGLMGDPYSDRIDSMRKHVVSSTLRDPEWTNTTVIDGDPVAAIRRLKAEEGKDIVQYGFGRLSHALIYRDGPVTTFELRDTTPLASGTVVLTYAA